MTAAGPTFNNEDAVRPHFEKLRRPDDRLVCPHCSGVVELEKEVTTRVVARAGSHFFGRAFRIASGALETLCWMIVIFLFVYWVCTLDRPQFNGGPLLLRQSFPAAH